MLLGAQQALAAESTHTKETGTTKEAGTTPKRSELPTASTGGAHTHGSTVELAGTINPRGEATSYYFQYGPTSAYGSQTPTASLPAGTVKVRVTQPVAGLQPGSHYRLVVTDARGTTVDGHDHTYAPATKKRTTTPNKAAERLKFTLGNPPPEGQPVGSSISIVGSLSGLGSAGHQIVLQSDPYPYDKAFTTLAVQNASTGGRFSFYLAHLTRNTRFRVLAPGPAPTYSSVITELATVRVTFHVRSAPHGGLARLYGTVSPAVTGAVVFFQLQRIAGPKHLRAKIFKSEKAEEKAQEKAEERAETLVYSTVLRAPVKHATRASSRFSSVVAIRKAGVYRAYVVVPAGPIASGYSTNLTLRATVEKKGKRKG
jgi:hypothetical protein